MPGEVIDRPNPQPLPSHLPDDLEKLSIKLSHETLDPKACDGLFKYRRAAAYIAAGEKLQFISRNIFGNHETKTPPSNDLLARQYTPGERFDFRRC